MNSQNSNIAGYRGKTVWIVGASTGIGAALAHELDERGAHLVLSARREDILTALNHKLGNRHQVLPLDVTDYAALQSAVNACGDVDVAVLMAGTYEPGLLENADLQEAHKIIDVNFKGTLNFVHALYPRMIKMRRGVIALCGSVAGYCGLPNSQPYSATKAAVKSLAESLKTEAQEYGIDIKLISPGFVKTPMTSKNDFDMPMIIEPEEAAKIIADGLMSPRFEIHFPRKFTVLVKIVAALPYSVFFAISRSILKQKKASKS